MTYVLQAGPVQVRYEAGFLRYLTLDRSEVVRMIYFVLRDRHWKTASLTISDETIEQTDDTFWIRYDWQTNDSGLSMAGNVNIRGGADGTITVDFLGEAHADFLKNRVGLCVLHPLDGVTGQPCQIEQADSQRVQGHFPTYISPHQPFLNIRAMRWQPASGHDVCLWFAGDVFETEDQRNWTDASFKTYSTPLRLPFPALMKTGDRVQQQVRFGIVSRNAPVGHVAPTLSVSPVAPRTTPSKQPRIGLGQRADGQPLTESEAARLRDLGLSHLRTDVFLTAPDWQTYLTNALADARLLGVSLELALFFGYAPTDELATLGPFLGSDIDKIGSVLLFSAATLITSDALLNELVPAVRVTLPNALIGGGTDGNFAEFNRNLFDYQLVDFVTYSVNPQVHAVDDLTLLENIAGQEPTVETARQLTGGKPVHISPVTLLPRFTTIAGSAAERRSPPIDPRQHTDFGADWTRQSLAALSRAGVTSVTFYETHGPRGVAPAAFIVALA